MGRFYVLTIHKLKTAGAEDETDLETLSYTYDANGNIKTVSVNGVLQDKYAYDYLGQLVRHDDAAANKSFYYTYDEGGNITKKREYAYTTGTLSNPTSTINYTYDTTWKDKLISYNGNAITYDEIGNPLTYNGYTFSWQKGRQLATISGNGVELSFKYNADGLRTEKTNGTTTTQYYYSGAVLLAQYSGGNYLKFLYSADGELIGFMKNNTPYYYIKNQQGDILYIYDNTGSLMSEYRYDAWGKCTVLKADGTVDTDPTSIGNVNPIRYRGYYYDTETNLYYLQSRYYNPEWGRFVNGDGYVQTGDGLYDKNMFAYCLNNPVNSSDPSGQSPWLVLGVIAICGVVGGIIGYNSKEKLIDKPKTKQNSSNYQKQSSSNNNKNNNISKSNSNTSKSYSSTSNRSVTRTQNRGSISHNSEKTRLSSSDRAMNTFIGATLGIAVGGVAVILIGAGCAIGGVMCLGATGTQAAAIGCLAFNAEAIIFAPFYGVELEPIAWDYGY